MRERRKFSLPHTRAFLSGASAGKLWLRDVDDREALWYMDHRESELLAVEMVCSGFRDEGTGRWTFGT